MHITYVMQTHAIFDESNYLLLLSIGMQEYKYTVPQNVTKNSIIVLHIFLAGLSISWLLKITPLQSSCVASSGHIWQLTIFCRNAFFVVVERMRKAWHYNTRIRNQANQIKVGCEFIVFLILKKTVWSLCVQL